MERAAVAKAQRCESACVHRTARVAVKCEAEARREEGYTVQEGAGLHRALPAKRSVRPRHRGLVRLQLGCGQFCLLK